MHSVEWLSAQSMKMSAFCSSEVSSDAQATFRRITKSVCAIAKSRSTNIFRWFHWKNPTAWDLAILVALEQELCFRFSGQYGVFSSLRLCWDSYFVFRLFLVNYGLYRSIPLGQILCILNEESGCAEFVRYLWDILCKE